MNDSGRLTAGRLCRAVAPRRKWRLWAIVLLCSWGAAAVFLAFARPAWRDAWRSLYIRFGFGMYLGPSVVLMWAGLAGAWLGPAVLFADIRGGRLQPMILTGIDDLVILRAYHRLAFVTVLLLLGAGAPVRFLEWLPETDDAISAAAGAGANLLGDAATGCLATAVGLALCAALRRQLWGVPLALLTCWLLAIVGTLLLNRLFLVVLNGLGWFEPQRVWIESFARSTVMVRGRVGLVAISMDWMVDGVKMLVAAPLSALALRLAARRLGRLVTD